ncbi:MAG TPA: MFS transporter, partial [Candidatus Edwardsbacteria bacterium]|nr:MFS transporter [Candidatus Edwardsbacteria bacterium]
MLDHRNEPRRSLRLSIVEGSFAAVHITLTGGALVTGYALMLGANDFHLGLLSALGALSTVGSLVSAQLVGLLGSRRWLTVLAATGGRALWALLCLLPFLRLLPGARLWLFFAVVFLANTLVNMANNAWTSWMTDLVPLERRGAYFGVRNTILGAVGMAANFGAGKLFDWFKAGGRQIQGYAWIFGAAALCAMIGGAILSRQHEPPLRGERQLSLRSLLAVPLANRDFRRLLWFFVLWSVATSLAGPFFGAHMIKNLKMPFSTIAVYSIVAGVLNLTLQPLWGKVIDRVGNRPVLAFNIMGIFMLPLFWLFATPANYFPIWCDAFLTGFFWPGFGLATFNLLLVTAPDENRTAYLAVQSVLTGLAVFLASLLGGWAANALRDVR